MERDRKIFRKLKIDDTRCKSCALCTEICPQHILTISECRNAAGYCRIALLSADKCTGCGLCVLICPEPQCLTVEIIEDNSQ